MNSLSQRLLKTIRQRALIRPGDRVAVAVSGGADSAALLGLLLDLRTDLGIVLSIAHVNHKLRGEDSDRDHLFVAELAARHDLEFHLREAVIAPDSSGIEAAARESRYAFFRDLARVGHTIATAHTLDDQAETVLMRMFRGTGIRGLAGIRRRLVFPDLGHPCGEVVRPLLDVRREALRQFLRDHGQAWREDSSNCDPAFLRNRLRQRLLPVLTEVFGEAVLARLSDLAEIAFAEHEHWRSDHPHLFEPARKLEAIRDGRGKPLPPPSLVAAELLQLSVAAQRRLLRAWLEANPPGPALSFRIVEQVRELARGPAGKKIELPGHRCLRRGPLEIVLETTWDAIGRKSAEYQYGLPVPGTISVPELGTAMIAELFALSDVPNECHDQLLDPALLPGRLAIRNWRAGDRYWPAHSSAPRKVKELLSERQARGTAKKLWPVAVAEGLGIVWMRGFPVPAALRPVGAEKAGRAVWIRETYAPDEPMLYHAGGNSP